MAKSNAPTLFGQKVYSKRAQANLHLLTGVRNRDVIDKNGKRRVYIYWLINCENHDKICGNRVQLNSFLQSGSKLCKLCGSMGALLDNENIRALCRRIVRTDKIVSDLGNRRYQRTITCARYDVCGNTMLLKSAIRLETGKVLGLCSPCCNRRLPEYKSLYNSLKTSARKRFPKRHHLFFSFKQFLKAIEEKKCIYCLEALPEKLTRGIRAATNYSLDRLDNSETYTKGNVAPCCFDCNHLKSDKFSKREAMLFSATRLGDKQLFLQRLKDEKK